ncbi:gamma carbonic anhydrase family protein [Methanosarcina sp. A14]|uniref:Carbonic anhydrase, family 3 n=2 Tax=Methanosarcina barkeri TaxID=2208 RepID=A0A0E3QXJ5_METBA|nr:MULTISPECIES: gamma carbonic anhydrase family protein [Methanosarcina]AKB55550.1 carbonic anhydrase, family 3 [Methanosarcina barkeri MS]AKJ38719.1 hexapeptide repeat-containing acetyltransferase [Methanosarcina barkeri CM1]OED06403.1 gamma carbonic anhydrase family protein [Methanosarcina sp. A14]
MIMDFKGKSPKISETVFIADSADVIGDIEIGDFSSVWFNAVLRGDRNKIKIGSRTSIQDNVVIHADPANGVQVGNDVTVGHGAVLHGCRIENNVLIGMNSTILNGAEIGRNSIVGANALISEGKKFPENSLIIGVPGKVKREIEESEIEAIAENAAEYVEFVREYREEVKNIQKK